MNSPDKPTESSVVPFPVDPRRGLPAELPDDGCLTGRNSTLTNGFLQQSTDHALYLAIADVMRAGAGLNDILGGIAAAAGVSAKDVCIVHFRKTKNDEWRGNMAFYFHHSADNMFFSDMKDSLLTGAIPNKMEGVFAAVADTPALVGAIQVLDAYFKLVVDLGSMRVLLANR